MPTVEELLALQQGDEVETVHPLLHGLTDEKVRLWVKEVQVPNKFERIYVFVVTYFGVTLDACQARVIKDRAEWSNA